MEATETLQATISNPSHAGVAIGTASATANITDNDSATADLSVTTHGVEGGTNIVYTVTLSQANNTGGNITFDIASSGGSATSGADYTAIPGGAQIVVADGATTGTYTVLVTNDVLMEATETLQATISNPSHAGVAIGTASATANITDNDSATVTVSAIDPSAGEPAGSNDGQFRVDLGQVNSTGAPITVFYTVLLSSTAAAGGDYTALSGSVQIAAGAQTATIDVNVLDDGLVEGNETVTIQLTGTDHPQAGVDPSAATVTIADDDNAPVINDAIVALAENSPNGTPVYNVDDGGDDADADGDPLTYSITGGTGMGVFAINPATGLITVANSAALDFETTPSFTLTVLADDGFGNTDTAQVTINLTNVNEAPVNTVPAGPLGATEDTVLAITGLSISDPDGGAISVNLTVANGVLTVTLPGGATISGAGTGALTVSGTQAQVNTALSSLRYQGNLNYFGPDTLNIATSDGTLSDNDAVAISVAPVNDAPVLGNNSFTITAGTPLVLSGGNLSATDIEDGVNLSFTVAGLANGFFLVGGAQSNAFTQAQLLAGQVQFVHNGIGAPSFSLMVVDSGGAFGPFAANISFNAAGGFTPPPPAPTPPAPSGITPLPSVAGTVAPNSPSSQSFTAYLRGPTSPGQGGEGEQKVQALEMQVAQPPTGVVKTERVFVPSTALPAIRPQMDSIDTKPQRVEPQAQPLRAEAPKGPLPLDEEERQQIEVVLTSVRVTGLAVSVGAVWWAARAVGLVASLLSATPAWRHVDPLPVLGRDEKEPWDEVEEKDKDKKDEEHRAAWILEEREARS
jgi:hypothetical protein